MRKIVLISLVLGLAIGPGEAALSSEKVIVKPNAAKRFATLPDDARFPEGIAANPSTHEIFVGTFDFGPNSNRLIRFGKNGKRVAERDFGGTPLLGLAFNPRDGKVYIANFGASQIQRLPADFDGTTPIETVALVGPSDLLVPPAPDDRIVPNPDGATDDIINFDNGFAAPNSLIFDSADNLYFSDSFRGAVFRIDTPHLCAPTCVVNLVVQNPLLATAGFPPFGANGLALDEGASVLYVANTGDDRVLAVDLDTDDVSVIAESINGADGLALDDNGLLWVVANQADQITVLDENGKVIAELGEHLGIKKDGSTRGLLFPASLVFLDGKVYVTNLALPLFTPLFVGDEPEDDVVTYTVSRINVPKL